MQTLDGRARLGELARPLLERLPAGMFREMMQQALHERIGLHSRPGAPGANTGPRPAARPRIARPQGSIPPIRRAVALLVQNPGLAVLEDLPGGWEGLDSPGIKLLQELLQTIRQQPQTNSAALVERLEDPDMRRHLAKLTVLDLGIIDDAEAQFVGTLRSLALEQVRAERENLLAKSRQTPLTEEEKQRLRELYRIPNAQ
jgi:DNA primase